MEFSPICLFLLICRVSADTLVWSDDFNGSSGQQPDASKWVFNTGGDGWGNQERQYYTNSQLNAALDGTGNLVITARRENNGNFNCWYGRCEYTSARLITAGKFSQMYGAFEARIKIPTGKGIWPAFWMLGDDVLQAGWPQCGEIDIMENVGNEPLAIHGTLHGPGYSGGSGLTSTFNSPNNQPFTNDFHVYRADWTANSISFSVDGRQYATKTPSDTGGNRWVFDHKFFIILNLAVGGGWPGSPDGSTMFPQQMIVDYVRVFSKDDTNPSNRQGQIRGIGGRCVDVRGANTDNGAIVQVFDCNGTPAQLWSLSADRTIRALGKCLSVNGGSANGTPVVLNDCNGSAAQKWDLSASGDIVNSNKCLDAKQPANQNSAPLQIWDCAGTSNQKWNLP
ncbi:beta-glucanase-like [Bradysia coprophila]|uniref:beta-glucanase-like n=1 Tax=Bradysia coprophila TaxID=38358 RepID=UPI00187DC5D7|nr:beta-glucanase-like [Bradysia coprophila]